MFNTVLIDKCNYPPNPNSVSEKDSFLIDVTWFSDAISQVTVTSNIVSPSSASKVKGILPIEFIHHVVQKCLGAMLQFLI